MAPSRPSDAFTRFTSTAPPASSSSPSSANSPFTARVPQSGPSGQPSPSTTSAPQNETPAQKVARLRAEHRLRNSQNKLSPLDKFISRGRTAADVAHRITTYSLLAFTGVSAIIATYGIISLVSHNRRQKRAWIEREMDRLEEARKSFLRGDATAEQLHLLEQERAGEELVKRYVENKEKRKAEGIFGRLKGTFGGIVSQGDMGSVSEAEKNAKLQQQQTLSSRAASLSDSTSIADITAATSDSSGLRPVAVSDSNVRGVGLDEKGRPVPIGKVEKVNTRTSPTPREILERGEISVENLGRPRGGGGGPLDVMADNITDKAQSTGQGWWGWVSGKSSSPSPPSSSSS